MDLVAEMLAIQSGVSSDVVMQRDLLQPRFRYRVSIIPALGQYSAARNLDRFFNRFVIYPQFAKRISADYDFFHVVDHSYAGLLHSLPSERTGVYCHDLDAFRCLIDPNAEPRPWWFRKMAGHILTGMQKANVVFHSTGPVREAILRHQLVDESKLVHAPYGVSCEFTSEKSGDELNRAVSHPQPGADDQVVVHVGSCIPRKRIDVLIDTFARVREANSRARLIKIGGSFTEDHRQRIANLGLQSFIEHRQGLSRGELADVYRRASVVLVPSEAEGFGLPVIEALACGAPVIASDIPVLREVGGGVVSYAPVGDIDRWASLAVQVLEGQAKIASREQRLAHVSQYTWARHAEIITQAYSRLM